MSNMSKGHQLMEALQILAKYQEDLDLSAEHDTLYISGPEPDRCSPEDRKKLENLRVFWDEGVDSWRKFT